MTFKLSIIVALMALVTYGEATVTCDECKIATGNLRDTLLTADSLRGQGSAIAETICPGMEEPSVCEGFIGLHWPFIGQLVYPFSMVPEYICGLLESCPMRQIEVKEWTCEECVSGIVGIAQILSSAESVNALKAYLKTDAFCGMPEDHMPEECPDLIDTYIPPALEVIEGLLQYYSLELCNGVVQGGLCP